MKTIITIILADGQFVAASAVGENNLPVPLDAAALAAFAPDINGAALALIAIKEEMVKRELTDTQRQRLELTAMLAEIQAQIDSLPPEK